MKSTRVQKQEELTGDQIFICIRNRYFSIRQEKFRAGKNGNLKRKS